MSSYVTTLVAPSDGVRRSSIVVETGTVTTVGQVDPVRISHVGVGVPGPTGNGQPFALMCGTDLTLARPDYPFVLWIVDGGQPINAIPTDLVARLDLTID